MQLLKFFFSLSLYLFFLSPKSVLLFRPRSQTVKSINDQEVIIGILWDSKFHKPLNRRFICTSWKGPAHIIKMHVMIELRLLRTWTLFASKYWKGVIFEYCSLNICVWHIGYNEPGYLAALLWLFWWFSEHFIWEKPVCLLWCGMDSVAAVVIVPRSQAAWRIHGWAQVTSAGKMN